MATLYRKYRPQTFNEVVGQNHIKVTLQNEIQSGKIAQAYLFCGPRAVGKTTLARVLSKAVNCIKRKNDEVEPCNKCEICEEITSGRNMDIIEIDAASHTGVDNVRENIIASARVAPSRCKYKVFIIDEVHMLSVSAFNALLKIIEEPPANVIFILCTTEIHKVPTTIISRCQRFDFKRIGTVEIAKKLGFIAGKEGIKVDKEILEDVARRSEGYMRDAESIFGQIISISGKEVTRAEADLVLPRSDVNEIINLVDCLAKKDSAGGVRLINSLVDGGVNLRTFTDDLIEILRKMMLAKINPSLSEALALELGESLEIKINEAGGNLSIEQIIAYIEKFIEAKNSLRESFIPQLPLELAVVELCLSAAPIIAREAKYSAIPSQPAAPVNVEQKTASKPLDESNPDIIEINAKWPEVLTKIKKYNHSLSFILRVCKPINLEGNKLFLAFKYKFHKDRISDLQIRGMVENVLKEVYNKLLLIEAVVDENLEINSDQMVAEPSADEVQTDAPAPMPESENKGGDQSDMISNLLMNFGGKIVK